MREEKTPILGREVGKPLRPEEYPSKEEIASLTGEVGASGVETVLKTMGMAAPVLAVPLLVRCTEIPETPPAVTRTPEEVGLEPTPTLEIKTPTAEPTPTEKITPSPTATEEPTVTATFEPATSTPEEATPTPEQATPTPGEATPTPEPQEPQIYVTVQKITSYSSPEEEHGYIIPGKKFTILKEEDGWLYIRLEAGAEVWIQASETAYYPEGEVPPSTPTPETPPPAVCTEPYYAGRTSDRKTGVVINFGTPRQQIFPERSYEMWYFRMPGNYFVSRRDARITEIDRRNQIITFQLNDDSTRQRRFTPNTQIVMIAHNVYAGMPYSEYKQTGGNLCDLEVDDVMSSLHPDEAESANPNLNLVDLWGILIVQ